MDIKLKKKISREVLTSKNGIHTCRNKCTNSREHKRSKLLFKL